MELLCILKIFTKTSLLKGKKTIKAALLSIK